MQSNDIKPAMQYGLITGVLFSLNFLLSVAGNPYAGALSNVISILIPIVVYQLTVRFRTTECDGILSYYGAFRFILRLFIYGSLISAMTKYIYLKFINPECSDMLYEHSMQLFTQIMKTPVGKEEQEALKEMYSPVNYTLVLSIGDYIAGVIVALIMAFFIKRDTNTGNKNQFSQYQ